MEYYNRSGNPAQDTRHLRRNQLGIPQNVVPIPSGYFSPTLISMESQVLQPAANPCEVQRYCTTCNKYFSTSYEYTLHNRQHYEQNPQNNYTCPYCNQRFLEERFLKSHISIHKMENFKCKKCSASFTEMSLLQKHMFVHFTERKESHTCGDCGICFDNSIELTAHNSTHINDNKSLCNICHENFSCNDLLSLHRKVYHEQKKNYNYINSLKNVTKYIPSVAPQNSNFTSNLLSNRSDYFDYVHSNIQNDMQFNCNYTNSSSEIESITTSPDIIPIIMNQASSVTNSIDLESRSPLIELHSKVDEMIPDINNQHEIISQNQQSNICEKDSNEFLHTQHNFFAKQESTDIKPPALNESIPPIESIPNFQINDGNITPYFICDTCNKIFVHKVSLILHMRNHIDINKYQCKVCHGIFDKSMKRDHANEKYSCDECDVIFCSKLSLKLHKSSEHDDDMEYNCVRCGTEFESKKLLENHMEFIHLVSVKSDKVLVENSGTISVPPIATERKTIYLPDLPTVINTATEPQIYSCKICKEPFKNLFELDNHRAYVHKEKVMKCSKCNKKFASNCLLHRHIKKLHIVTGRCKYQCHLCCKVYATYNNLRKHLSTLHPEYVQFKCRICDVKKDSMEQYIEHLKIHEIPKPYLCETCGKEFLSQKELQIHFRIHTKEKPHVCNICEKSFNSITKLRLHSNIHIDPSRISCDYCSNVYSTKQSLSVHTRRKHFDAISKKKNELSLLKCSICREVFVLEGTLAYHMLTEHHVVSKAAALEGNFEHQRTLQTLQDGLSPQPPSGQGSAAAESWGNEATESRDNGDVSGERHDVNCEVTSTTVPENEVTAQLPKHGDSPGTKQDAILPLPGCKSILASLLWPEYDVIPSSRDVTPAILPHSDVIPFSRDVTPAILPHYDVIPNILDPANMPKAPKRPHVDPNSIPPAPPKQPRHDTSIDDVIHSIFDKRDVTVTVSHSPRPNISPALRPYQKVTNRSRENVSNSRASVSIFPLQDSSTATAGNHNSAERLPNHNTMSIFLERGCTPTILPHQNIPNQFYNNIIPNRLQQTNTTLATCTPISFPHRDIIPSSFPHRDVIPSSFPHRDVIPSSFPHRDVIPNNFPHRDVIPSSFSHRDVIPTSFPHRDVIPTSFPHRDVIPTNWPRYHVPATIQRDFTLTDLLQQTISGAAYNRDVIPNTWSHSDVTMAASSRYVSTPIHNSDPILGGFQDPSTIFNNATPDYMPYSQRINKITGLIPPLSANNSDEISDKSDSSEKSMTFLDFFS